MSLTAKCKNLRDRIPLWMQLALFTTLITFTVLVYLIYTDYQRYLGVITDTRIDTSSRLLSMEVSNLEKYISELSLFCVQSCYDQTFSNIVEKDTPILPGEETYLRNQIRAYYYSRSDLKNLDFYLLNHSRRFTRTQDGIRSQAFSVKEAERSSYYQECLDSPYFHAIFPSQEPDTLFHYYHSLLRIKTRKPFVPITAFRANLSVFSMKAAGFCIPAARREISASCRASRRKFIRFPPAAPCAAA